MPEQYVGYCYRNCSATSSRLRDRGSGGSGFPDGQKCSGNQAGNKLIADIQKIQARLGSLKMTVAGRDDKT